MANPTAKVMTYDTSKQSSGDSGAGRDFWMRFPGLRGASDQDAGGNDQIYYLENPFQQDLVVLQILAIITTVDAQDGDIDVGLVDDAIGTDSIGTSEALIDSLVNSTLGVYECLTPSALACTTKRYIWKAKGSATQAFLNIVQNADAAVDDLRWTLMLRVMPYDDMINSNVELGAIAVA